jgi:hypothetical protein
MGLDVPDKVAVHWLMDLEIITLMKTTAFTSIVHKSLNLLQLAVEFNKPVNKESSENAETIF